MRPRSIATLAAVLLASACSFHVRDDDWDLFGNLPRETKEESQPLEIERGGALRIEETTGDVRVRVDATAAPRVDARWTARAQESEDAHALLSRSSLEIEKIAGGDRPSLRLRVKSSDAPAPGCNPLLMHVEVELTLTIPADVELRIATRYGDVTVDGPVGAVTIDAPHGDVRVVDAKETRVTSSSGKIALERIRGRLDTACEYESVEIEDFEGPALHARSRSGSIRLRNARADRVDVEAAYGDLSLDRVAPRARDLEVTATTGSGDLSARDVTGSLDASNRSGTIRIDGFRGDLRARSEYGDVALDGELAALDAETGSGTLRVVARAGSRVASPWRIETRYGDVAIDVPRDLDAQIDAATTHGRISGDVDVKSTGGDDDHRASAKVGAGGGAIRITTSNGDVRILRR
jgi:DUF4097 and DUF4098 domain-containing protein YvlB